MIAQLFGTNKFLDMLGMPKFWFILAVIVGLIVALVFCIKYFNNGGKFVLLTLFIVIMVSISAYSGIQLNYYYNARGGIHGVLNGIFHPNEVTVVDSIKYEFSNIELTQEEENTYSAKIIISEVMELDKDTVYGVYVNDMPCTYVENSSDYVLAKYVYKFYDDDLREIIEDELTLRFAFYTNSTYLSLSTNGGANAVKYWNYYFNKNLFVVSVAPTEYIESDNIEFGSGDVSEFVTAKYVCIELDKTILLSYVKGTIVNFSEISENYFDGGIYEWRVNGVKVEDNYKLDEDTTFQVIRTINGKYSFAGTCSGEEVTATFDIIDGEVQNVVSSNKYGFSDLFFYVTIINGDFDYRIKVEFYLRTDPVMSPVSFGCILFDYSQGQFTLYQTSGGDVSGTVTRIK